MVHIPLDLRTGRPIVEMRINNAGPFRFGLDTSVKSALVIDKKIANALALSRRGISRIELGGAELVNLTAVVGDARDSTVL